MAEVVQSLELCARAGDRTAFGGGWVEAPRGRTSADGRSPSVSLLDRLPDLLPGLEWGDGVATIWSLDIDPMVGVGAAADVRGEP